MLVECHNCWQNSKHHYKVGTLHNCLSSVSFYDFFLIFMFLSFYWFFIITFIVSYPKIFPIFFQFLSALLLIASACPHALIIHHNTCLYNCIFRISIIDSKSLAIYDTKIVDQAYVRSWLFWHNGDVWFILYWLMMVDHKVWILTLDLIMDCRFTWSTMKDCILTD